MANEISVRGCGGGSVFRAGVTKVPYGGRIYSEMNNRPVLRLTALLILIAFACRLPAQVPQLINYQGRVAVGAANFSGSGAFKFALVCEFIHVFKRCASR